MTDEDKERLERIERKLDRINSILDHFLPTIDKLMKHPMLTRFITKR